MLIRHYDPSGGGAERYCVELSNKLSIHNNLHVFAQTVVNPSPDITIHIIPKWLERPRFINQLLFSWFTHKATKGQFDIVHSHDMVTHANIQTLHVPCFKTKWTESHGFRKWLRWLNTFFSPRKIAYLWLEKHQVMPKIGKQLIAVSELLEKNIIMNYPETEGRITVAYPGIHISSHHVTGNNDKTKKNNLVRSKYDIPRDVFVLLFVANDFRKKGLQTVLDALKLLHNPMVHLIIAGNGQNKQLKVPYDIRTNIHFLGTVNNMPSLYQSADLFIHPTRVDTYGMSVLEAMSHNVPVIVSGQAYCGFSEHLSPQEASLLDNPYDAEEIATRINHLFSSSKERNRMAQLGWEKSQTISWDQTAQATQSVYNIARGSIETS